ncbi:hypothetical protein EU545_05605 [Candidatus Thorarchaeota archaeon]|nr:MAG: hypothetical protein EU545_05605 [Candidatus Thorarchaeota archaeon]
MVKMSEEDKYRVETPDEEEEEKKGLFKPLPEKEYRPPRAKDRPQPVVKLLGISMYENKRDSVLLILMPLLTAIVNVTIYSFVTVRVLGSDSLYLFFIPALTALPIGLTIPETGKALIGGALASVFFLILYIFFLGTPGLIIPGLNIGDFLLSGIALSIVPFILMMLATLLGSVIGTIMREFL